MIIDAIWWVLAVFLGLLPERVWPRLDSRLPLHRAAFLSGIATLSVGFFAGFAGFLRFLTRTADANNVSWPGAFDQVRRSHGGFMEANMQTKKLFRSIVNRQSEYLYSLARVVLHACPA